MDAFQTLWPQKVGFPPAPSPSHHRAWPTRSQPRAADAAAAVLQGARGAAPTIAGMAHFPRSRPLIALAFVAVLAACATTPPEATVQVFTSQPRLPAGATYRFDRLPSQAGQPGQAALEATADALLAQAGLRRDDSSQRLAVQVDVQQDLAAGGFGGWGGSSVGLGIGGGSGGGGIGIGLGIPIGGGGPRPTERVGVQMRDLATGQVIFQSQASGGSGSSPAALLGAALRDFPNVPPGTRQVPLAQAPSR